MEYRGPLTWNDVADLAGQEARTREMHRVVEQVSRRPDVVQDFCTGELYHTSGNRFPQPHLLLLPNIPKPLHGVNPRSILGRVWWDKERFAAFQEFDGQCWACGRERSLEGHEEYHFDYNQGIISYVGCTALCRDCHNFIHNGRMLAVTKKDEMSIGTFWTTMYHGFSILKMAKLRPNAMAIRACYEMLKTSRPVPLSISAWANRKFLEKLMKENPITDVGEDIPWEDWLMKIGEDTYGPKYKSFESWLECYDPEESQRREEKMLKRILAEDHRGEPGDPAEYGDR